MSNMSYCRFENTLHDLQDCYEAMKNDRSISTSEKLYRERLIKLCKQIADNFETEEN
jgi:hypothetical protein